MWPLWMLLCKPYIVVVSEPFYSYRLKIPYALLSRSVSVQWNSLCSWWLLSELSVFLDIVHKECYFPVLSKSSLWTLWYASNASTGNECHFQCLLLAGFEFLWTLLWIIFAPSISIQASYLYLCIEFQVTWAKATNWNEISKFKWLNVHVCK